MDKTFQRSLQKFLDLKYCSHYNEKDGIKHKKDRQANFFVGEVIDPPSVLISSKQSWE